MATVKTFLIGVAKVAAAIVAAVLVLALIGYGISEVRDGSRKRDALPFEAVKTWEPKVHDALGMKLKARSKVVNGMLYLDLNFDGYPQFLSDQAARMKNADRNIIIQFYDSDGFKVFEKPILIRDFTTIVGPDSKPAGLGYEMTQALSVDEYRRWSSAQVGWNVDTKVFDPDAYLNSPTPKAVQDHCAPDLSKAERLRRLAQRGTVRETGFGGYAAGGRSVTFLSDGSLLSCQ